MSVGRYTLLGGTAILTIALTLCGVPLRAVQVPGRVTVSSDAAVGFQGCAGSGCHASENDWLTSQAGGQGHRSSFVKLRLTRDNSVKYARAVGLSNFEDPTGMCVQCHGLNVAATKSVEGLGCESCHGRASRYRAFHAQSPRDYAGAVQRGMRDLRGKPSTWVEMCRDCHVLIDRAEYRPLLGAGHPDGRTWSAARTFANIQKHWTTVSYTVNTIGVSERPAWMGVPSGGGGSPPPKPPDTVGKAPPPAPRPAPAGNVLPDFPWPPPAPSAQAALPNSMFLTTGRPAPSLSSVGATLVNALERARYFEYSYYRAPNGFALVARLERIATDGTPMPEELRFLLPGSEEPFSLAAYLKRLFFAPEGLYRQIVFTVTDQPFTATGTPLNATSAARLLSKGANRLTSDFDTLPFTDGHRVTALIYEFKKNATAGDVSTLTPSRLGARTHLEKAGIYQALVVR